MKKIVSLLLSVIMVATLCAAFTVTSSAETEKTVEWLCWKQDGNEITQGKVAESSEGIVADLSSNWYVRQQDRQDKITDTYWSPATVWTNDATKDMSLTWEVDGNAFVQIGFLHCIGKTGDGVSVVCLPDGSDLVSKCKIEWSADGSKWNEIDSDILEGEHVIVSGMTGYEAEDIKPYNGNVEAGEEADQYSEKYFIISGRTGDDAKYVRYTYFANSRINYWDPCVRDASFTYTVEEESSEPVEASSEEPVQSDASEKPAEPTSDSGFIALAIIAALAVAGAVAVKKSR